MKKNKVTVDQKHIDRQNFYAKQEASKLIESVSNFQTDLHKENRKKLQQCKRCFYLRNGTIACQAFCDQDCGICSKTMSFSSSDTNIVCDSCAASHNLCAKCGADMDLKPLKPLKKSKLSKTKI